MRRFLGLAVLATAMLLALTAAQAAAGHVQCGDVITQDTTLDSDLMCASGGPALTIGAAGIRLNLDGHLVRGGITEGPCATEGPVPEATVEIANGRLDGGIEIGCSTNLTFRGLRLLNGSSIGGKYSEYVLIEDSRFEGFVGTDPVYGTPYTFGGVRTWVTHTTVRNNVFENGNGISIRGGATVADNTITGATTGVDLFKGGGEVARN